MGIGGIWQWVVVLAIVLLLFGTKKLRNMGGDLGQAVKGFRKGMKPDTESVIEKTDNSDNESSAGTEATQTAKSTATAESATGNESSK